MSDETELQQRQSKRKTGEALVRLIRRLRTLGLADVAEHGAPPQNGMEWPTEAATAAVDSLRGQVKSNLNWLKRLIDRGEYEDAADLLDELRSLLAQGFDHGDHNHHLAENTRAELTQAMDAIEDIMFAEMWTAESIWVTWSTRESNEKDDGLNFGDFADDDDDDDDGPFGR